MGLAASDLKRAHISRAKFAKILSAAWEKNPVRMPVLEWYTWDVVGRHHAIMRQMYVVMGSLGRCTIAA